MKYQLEFNVRRGWILTITGPNGSVGEYVFEFKRDAVAMIMEKE
jgi:hypothetical protein